MSNLSSRWVPRMMTSEHKLKKVDIFRTLLTYFQAHSKNFYNHIVSKDKNRFHHFEAESKIQSKLETLWFSILEKVEEESISWQGGDFCLEDSEGVIIIDYLIKVKKKKNY